MAAIQSIDIIQYASLDRTDTDNNGGRMNDQIILTSNTAGNLFPDVTETERLDGRTGTNALRAKIYPTVRNNENKTYKTAKLWIDEPLISNYVASVIEGNFADTWGDVKTNRKYGVGNIDSVPSYSGGTGKTTIVVNTKGASYNHLQTGDLMVITDLATIDDATGKKEFFTAENVVYAGDQATITVDGQLRNAYNTSRVVGSETVYTRVASCIEYGDVACTFSVTNNTSAHGTYDTNELLPRNVGAISQIITLTFTSATAFDAVSNISGVTLTSGNRTALWEPPNPDGGNYLGVPASFWTNDGSGDWQAGDSVQIHTEPPSQPVFAVLDIPAGSIPVDLELFKIWGSGNSGSA